MIVNAAAIAAAQTRKEHRRHHDRSNQKFHRFMSGVISAILLQARRITANNNHSKAVVYGLG